MKSDTSANLRITLKLAFAAGLILALMLFSRSEVDFVYSQF